MAADEKKKTGYLLQAKEAAEYLRWLADQVEAEAVELAESGGGLDWLIKIKESIKTKADQSAHKIKIKFSVPLPEGEGRRLTEDPPVEGLVSVSQSEKPEPPAGPEPQDPAKQPYKKLKKQMAKEFSALKKALKEGMLPDRAAVAAFHGLCLAMTGHPGRGDEHYLAFEAAAGKLAAAAEAEVQTRLGAALEELDRLKSRCHKAYK